MNSWFLKNNEVSGKFLVASFLSKLYVSEFRLISYILKNILDLIIKNILSHLF